MASKTVAVGMYATYDPFLDHTSCNGFGSQLSRKVTGKVVYVNEQHRWFSVEDRDGARISFLFDDIGTGPGKKVVLS